MKVFIRSKQTSLLYSGGKQWVLDEEDAAEFKDSGAAVAAALKLGHGVEIFYSFGDPDLDFAVSLPLAPRVRDPNLPGHRARSQV